MEHHQLVIIPHLLEECEAGDLTTDRSDADDARGTWRSPLTLQPLVFKDSAADNNQKRSSIWAATISVITMGKKKPLLFTDAEEKLPNAKN